MTPSLIYWTSVLPLLKMCCGAAAVCGLLAVLLSAVAVYMLANDPNPIYGQHAQTCREVFKTSFKITLIATLLVILIPSKNTLYKMYNTEKLTHEKQN